MEKGPETKERNREIGRATERLVKEVIPALAKALSAMSESEVTSVDISVFFHRHGVNMRHMGLVRSHIEPSLATNSIRTKLLLQIVTRTLKNIARDYQRRWMKCQQSTSETGLRLLLTQFINLIVGGIPNSEVFWTDKVIVGIIQRFGKCAVDNNEHLHEIRKESLFLKVTRGEKVHYAFSLTFFIKLMCIIIFSLLISYIICICLY